MQDEDGNNSTLYADRYYPEGYLPGDDMTDGVAEPEKPNLQHPRRPAAQNHRSQPQHQRYSPDRPNRDRLNNENRRVNK